MEEPSKEGKRPPVAAPTPSYRDSIHPLVSESIGMYDHWNPMEFSSKSKPAYT